jgi:hypothetical protein
MESSTFAFIVFKLIVDECLFAGWVALLFAFILGSIKLTWWWGTSKKRKYIQQNKVCMSSRHDCHSAGNILLISVNMTQTHQYEAVDH